MYLTQQTWLEEGPGRPARRRRVRGMGDACGAGFTLAPAANVCVPTSDNSVSVASCSPDLCLTLAFPWIGKRQDTGMIAGATCTCEPVLAIPAPWGVVITGVIAALFLGKLVRR